MIDIENQVYTRVCDAVKVQFPDTDVKSEIVFSPPHFPCVCIEEADNSAYRSSQDSGSNENHAALMYEVAVYTNRTSGKKTECKSIFNVVDEALTGLGFTRTMKNPVSMDDATKYRIIGRYTAIVSKDEVIYRR